MYLPGQPLEEGEELVYDHTAYHMYHEVMAALIGVLPLTTPSPLLSHLGSCAGADWCALFKLRRSTRLPWEPEDGGEFGSIQ